MNDAPTIIADALRIMACVALVVLAFAMTFLRNRKSKLSCMFGFHMWGNIYCPICGKKDEMLATAFRESFQALSLEHQQQIMRDLGYTEYSDEMADDLIKSQDSISTRH